jgi:hypothetical protein
VLLRLRLRRKVKVRRVSCAQASRGASHAGCVYRKPKPEQKAAPISEGGLEFLFLPLGPSIPREVTVRKVFIPE